MSRTRLIVSTVFIVLIGLFATSPAWAGGLVPGTPVTTAADPAANSQAVLLVDLNGDNKLDLVVVANSTNNIEIYPGNGDGTFGSRVTVNTGNSPACGPVSVAAGNLTGGTFPDLAVGCASQGRIKVLRNTTASNGATISFDNTIGVFNPPLNNNNPQGVWIADMNGDGKGDVILADFTNNRVIILLGNGSSSLTLTPTATDSNNGDYVVGTGPQALVVADFNNDGQLDIAVANKTAGTITILTQSSHSATDVSFTSTTSTVSGGGAGINPVGITAGKVGTTNAPNFPDLIVAINGNSKVGVLLNNGSGGFPANTTDTSVTGATTGVSLGDVDGDGHLDILASNASGVDLLINNGTGGFPSDANFAAGDNTVAASAGDLNGDGLADVAAPKSSGTTVDILLGDPFSAVGNMGVPTQTEGVQFGSPSIDLMQFQHRGDPASATFTATVDWGDAGPTSAGTVTDDGNVPKTYTVAGGPHTYAEQGNYNIKVSVQDANKVTKTGANNPVAVNDGALTSLGASDLTPIAPGGNYPAGTVVANFSDENLAANVAGDFDATLDWGDGTIQTCTHPNCGTLTAGKPQITGGSGTYAVKAGTGGHTYATSGTKTITVTVNDAEGVGFCPPLPNANPCTTGAMVIHATVGTVLVSPVAVSGIEGNALNNNGLFATVHSTGPGPLSAQIDWFDCPEPNGNGTCGLTSTGVSLVPDGTPPCATGTGDSCVFGSHIYAEKGSFSASVKVSDGGNGSSDTKTATVTIADAPLTAHTPVPGLAGTEGTSLGTVVFGLFYDDNPSAAKTDFTANIDYDDCGANNAPGTCAPGSLQAGVVLKDGDPGCSNTPPAGKSGFCVMGTKTYAYFGTFNTAYTVSDVDGSQITIPAGACPGSATDGCGAQAVIADAAIAAVAAGPAMNGYEGTPFSNVEIGTFDDPNPLATVGHFPLANVTVHWSDPNCNDLSANPALHCTSSGAGNVSVVLVCNSASPGGVCGNPATKAEFKVFATGHQYLEPFAPANTTFDVAEQQPGGSSFAGATGASANITEAPLVADPTLIPITGNEPLAVNQVIATFYDENVAATLAHDYPAGTLISINWGDGTVDTNGVIQAAGSTLSDPNLKPATIWQVVGVHTYAEGGADAPCGGAGCAIKVTVTDEGGSGPLTIMSALVVVNDAPLTPGAPFTIDNGSNGPLVVGLDPAGRFKGKVATWSDGNTNVDKVTLADYAANMPTSGVSIDFQDGPGADVVNCTNPAGDTPTSAAAAIPALANNTCEYFRDSDNGNVFTVIANHLYNNVPNPHTAVVTIQDVGGASTTVTDTANVSSIINVVAAPAPPNAVAGVIQLNEGDGVTQSELASFSSVLNTNPTPPPAVLASEFDNDQTEATWGATPNTSKSYVDWGDGTTGPCSSSSANTPHCVIQNVPLTSGAPATADFIIVGIHAYAEGGLDGPCAVVLNPGDPNPPSPNAYSNCTVVVHIVDNTDSSNQAANFNAHVFDAPLSAAGAQLPLAVNEGTALNAGSNVIVASFDDGNPSVPPGTSSVGDFTAQVDYNDCGANHTPGKCGLVAATVVANATPVGGQVCAAQYCVVGVPHTYIEVGNYPVLFVVNDKSGQNLGTVAAPASFVTAVIAEVPLAPGAPPATINGTEGVQFTQLIGTFTDQNTQAPLDDYSVYVDWGDGSPVDSCVAPNCGTPGTITVGGSGGNYTITGTHKYNEPISVANIHFRVIDGATLAIDFPAGLGAPVTILDGALTVTGPPAAIVNFPEGNPLNGGVPFEIGSFSDANPQAPACPGGTCDYTNVSIDWGDGNNSPGVVVGPANGPFTVQPAAGTHTYAGPGTYVVKFTLNDIDSGPGVPDATHPGRISAGTGITVTVVDAALGVTAPFNTGGAQGVALSGVVANFFDCNPNAPATDFGAPTIHWGDGSPTSAGTIAFVGTSANAACLPGNMAANFTVSGTHTYVNNNIYCIDIDVVDVDGAILSTASGASPACTGAAGIVTIAPGVIFQLPPTAFPPYSNVVTPPEPILNFEDSNPLAQPGNFAGTTINWGDGSILDTTTFVVTATGLATCQNPAVNPTLNPAIQCSTFSVSGSHVYGLLGLFPVTVTLGGAGGNQAFGTTLNITSISTAPFSMQVSPPDSQVHAGGSVDLLLTVSPLLPGGYTPPSPIGLGCAINGGPLPLGMQCTFIPSSTIAKVDQVLQIHVLVSTTAAITMMSPPPLPGKNGPVQLALLLPAFFGTFGLLLMAPRTRKSRRGTILWWGAGLLLLALLLAGCGNAFNGTNATPTPPGTYNITITATNASTVTKPIATIQVVP